MIVIAQKDFICTRNGNVTAGQRLKVDDNLGGHYVENGLAEFVEGPQPKPVGQGEPAGEGIDQVSDQSTTNPDHQSGPSSQADQASQPKTVKSSKSGAKKTTRKGRRKSKSA